MTRRDGRPAEPPPEVEEADPGDVERTVAVGGRP